MGKLKVAFSGKSGFEPLPDGEYEASINDYEIKESKAGNQYINWTFVIDESEDEFAGRKVWSMTSLKEGATWALVNLLEAAEVEFDLDEDAGEFDVDLDDALGCRVRLKLATDEYEGKEKNVVKKVLASQLD